MANDKKFIAKNGFLTSDADSSFTNSTSATPTVTFTNSGGAGASSLPGSGAVIAKFAGNSDAMVITNVSDGDYFFGNNQQNNGINFYDGTGGMEFYYNGVEKFSIDDSGITFATGHTTDGTTTTNRLLVEDNGSTSPLVVIKADDGSPWALAIGNDTYNTTEVQGHLFYQASNGNAIYQTRGNGEYVDWRLEQHNGSTARTAMNIDAVGTIELASDNYLLWGVDSTNRPGFLGDNTNKVLQFHNNGAERMRLDGSGNVGIGTDSPGIRLHAYHATTNVVGKIESGDDEVWLALTDVGTDSYGTLIGRKSSTNTLFKVADEGVVERFTILEGGAVGIGSTNPQYKLDVSGTSRVTGGLTISPGSSGHTSFELGSRSADPLPANTGSYDFKPGMRVGSYELGGVNATANIALAWATNDVSTSSPGYLAASQSYAGASWSQSFTVTQVAGTRWFVKVKLNDAEIGNDPRLAVNGGTEYQLEYLDAVNASGEAIDDSDTWHVIDVTDDIVTGNNVLKVWLNAGQKTYILAAYVFASTGIALPNEPAESTFYAHDGFGVQDRVIIDKNRNMTNIEKLSVGTTVSSGQHPDALIYVKGGISFEESTSASDGSVPAITQWSSNGTAQDLAIGARSGTGNIRFFTGNAGTGGDWGVSSNAERMAIDENGNVGINTDANAYGRLQVNQTSNDDESGIGILDSTAGRSMRLWTDSTSSYINSGNGGTGTLILNEGAGNVGIQNTSPNFPLHINKGTSSYSPSPGVNENVFGVNSTYDAAGSQYITFSRLDGNWLDGTTGADSAFGWLWNFQNNVRGGMMYDHRSTEQFQIFSSYAPIVFYTTDAADGNAVPTDSNMNQRMTIMPGGNVGIGDTSPDSKLHVTSASNQVAVFETTSTADMAIELRNSQGSMFMGLDGSENFGIGTDWDLNGANAKFTVTTSGHVGINKVTPASNLDIRETGTYNILQMAGSAGNYTGIKLARGDGTWSSASNNQFGLLVTDYGLEVTKFTALGDNSTGRLANPYMQFETDTADNVGIGTTAFDSVIEKESLSTNATSKFLINYTPLLLDKFNAITGSEVWGAVEPKPIRPSRIRSTSGTRQGSTYANSFGSISSSVVGEADLSAIDADATFTFAAAWAALEQHGARMPTLSEIMAGCGYGSGQGYDSEYLWTQTFAGPHHVWVCRGAYNASSYGAKIVDITDAAEVYRTRGFFDASHKNMAVHYDNNESITTNELMARGDVTAYYSDERLKDFQGTIPDALEKVNRINGYLFTENELAKQLGYNNSRVQAGVSAQEIEAVMPEVVKEAPINEGKGTDYKTVQYDRLVPLLIEAVKELSAKVDLQQEEIDRLKGL